MEITKHGIFHNKKMHRVNLFGKCDICKCEFNTYVDICKDSPEKGDFSFITDTDCTNMEIKPHFVNSEVYWMNGKIKNLHQALESFECFLPCPECKRRVELKEKVSE